MIILRALASLHYRLLSALDLVVNSQASKASHFFAFLASGFHVCLWNVSKEELSFSDKFVLKYFLVQLTAKRNE